MDFYKKITLLFIFIFLNTIVWGQDTSTTKTLYLKDGSFLLGSMKEHYQNGIIHIMPAPSI